MIPYWDYRLSDHRMPCGTSRNHTKIDVIGAR